MKKLFSFLLSLLVFATGFGQTSFPVQVTNQFDPIPIWAYNTGQKNNAFAVQFVTRTQVEAATNTGIGHLFALNGAFAPQPGKATIIRGFTVQSSKRVTMQIRVGTPTGVVAVANIPEMDIGVVVTDQPTYIQCNWIMRNIKSVFFNCLNFMDAADTAAWITITPDCYNIPDDFNFNARKRIEWVGTSITNGTGPTATGYMYHTLFKDSLRYLGADVRHELNGISGSTTITHYTFFTQGAYDHLSDGKAPDVLIIECAVNDASANVATADYVANLSLYSRRFLNNPEKKITVIILGATPLENTTAYNNSVVLDAAASALVTTLKASYPNRVYFIPLSSSFNRSVAANYISSDTPGARIHPSNSGCQQIMNNGFAVWLATADGQTFLTNIKK